MNKEEIGSPKIFLFSRVLWVMGFLLFSWYADIFVFQIPVLSNFVFPFVFIVMLAFILVRPGCYKIIISKIIFGFPVVLVFASISTVVLSNVHDRWLINQVRLWGAELRDQKIKTGSYPEYAKKRFHGYLATFFYDPKEPPVVVFNKYNGVRQSYLIDSDEFLDEEILN